MVHNHRGQVYKDNMMLYAHTRFGLSAQLGFVLAGIFST